MAAEIVCGGTGRLRTDFKPAGGPDTEIPDTEIIVIGVGLAGAEAARQIARLGGRVRLYEMRPVQSTPAHRTDRLAEIVCSNSFKSDQPYNASWLLKEKLRSSGSISV